MANSVKNVMKYTTVYSDPDGKSHFKDVTVEFKAVTFPDGHAADVSDAVSAAQAFFAKMPSGWFADWHQAEKRQFFCCLKGQIEITVGDGEKRVFHAGDVLLLEDTTGRGHLGKVVGETDFAVVVIPLTQ